MTRKCKHPIEFHRIKNEYYEECHGYHLSEYDIYCSKCGEELTHWAYGAPEPDYIIKYELHGIKKILTYIKFIKEGYIHPFENLCIKLIPKWYKEKYKDRTGNRKHASGYWFQFIKPRVICLTHEKDHTLKITRWLNFYFTKTKSDQ